LTSNQQLPRTLIILLGPTGVGKTALSIRIAKHFGTEIISCDSRQLFKEMTIGTAVPEDELLNQVPHHFIRSNSIFDNYHAARFETEVMERLKLLFAKHNIVLMTGGSMLYIDAVCNGIDDLPDIDPELRENLSERMKREGIESLRTELKLLDPVYYREVDLQNPVRIIHALEICYTTGKTFSSQRTKTSKVRDFEVVKIGLNRDRTELYDRINRRVDEMLASGLEQEAKVLYPNRKLNTLNTVGYRELFDYFDGTVTREEAIEKIKANTRKYARKQLTWFRKDPEIHWFHPDQEEEIIKLIHN
jgi:tRNA dimethylallyltransferase